MRGAFGMFMGRPHGCAGRHGHRRGFGTFFDGAFDRGDLRWQGFRSGRKLGGDDLQLLILALLAEKPVHGYEIIKALSERSGGFYSPSPGMVYPALTYLEEIDYASVQAEGTRKLYSITDAGRAHLEQNRELADNLFRQLKWVGEKMEHVRRAFAGEDSHAETAELRAARSELRAAIVEKWGSTDDEQRRVADVLKQAADAIRRKG